MSTPNPCRGLKTALQIAVLGAALSLVLGGCATLPQAEQPAPDQAQAATEFALRAAKVRAIVDWQAQGRMAIRTADRAGSVTFDWQQRGIDTQLILNAPLNQGTLTLRGTPDRMLIEDSQGQRRLTQQPDRTLTQLTGWHIPVQALPDWLRALPHARNAQQEFNAQGQLIRLKDEGWTLHYADYRPAFPGGVPMPHEMTAAQPDISLRLIIDQWQTLPAQP
ncbi:lipoprotein insertase outer membrane protein LolB [Halothiobacillus sp. DCM-1]|uniref:lipoprotein insertase outer membrane protein LolB n=1 Tax=Halothiobacillus sp. DCM-1 TaxID=3112558 RepID=UPI0032494092